MLANPSTAALTSLITIKLRAARRVIIRCSKVRRALVRVGKRETRHDSRIAIGPCQHEAYSKTVLIAVFVRHLKTASRSYVEAPCLTYHIWIRVPLVIMVINEVQHIVILIVTVAISRTQVPQVLPVGLLLRSR